MIDGSRYFWCPVVLPLISAAKVLVSSPESHSPPPPTTHTPAQQVPVVSFCLPNSSLSPKPQKFTKPTLNDKMCEGTNSPESFPQKGKGVS